MLPKLLISSDDGAIQTFVDAFIMQNGISKFEVSILGKENLPIKTEEVRLAMHQLRLSPSQGKLRLQLIYNSHNLTPEAQNSLLKNLEETPSGACFLLTTTNENQLFPTIVSRCEIIRLQSQIKDKGTVAFDFKISFKELSSMDLGEKFKLAEDLTKKLNKDEPLEEARQRVKEWLAKLIAEEKDNLLIGESSPPIATNLKILVAAQKQIRQNLNMRLVLENCLLMLHN